MENNVQCLLDYYLNGCVANFERISPREEGNASKLHGYLLKNPTRVSSLDSGLKRTLEDGTEVPIKYTPDEIFRSKRKQVGRNVSLKLNEPSERYPNLTRQQQFDNAIAVMQDPANKQILSDVNLVNKYEQSLRTERFNPALEKEYLAAKERLTAPDMGGRLNTIASAYDDVDNLRATSQPANVQISGLKSRVKDKLNQQLKDQGKDISIDNAYLDIDNAGLTIPSYVDKETLKGKKSGGTNYIPVQYKPTVKNDRATSRVRNKIGQVVNDLGLTNDPNYRRPITPQYVLNKGIIDTRDAANAVANNTFDISIPNETADNIKEKAQQAGNSIKSTVRKAATSIKENAIPQTQRMLEAIKQKVSKPPNTDQVIDVPSRPVDMPPPSTVVAPEVQSEPSVSKPPQAPKKTKATRKNVSNSPVIPKAPEVPKTTVTSTPKQPSNVEQVREILARNKAAKEAGQVPVKAATNVASTIPSRLLKNKLLLGGGAAALGGAGLLGIAKSLADSNASNNELRRQQLQNPYPDYYQGY